MQKTKFYFILLFILSLGLSTIALSGQDLKINELKNMGIFKTVDTNFTHVSNLLEKFQSTRANSTRILYNQDAVNMEYDEILIQEKQDNDWVNTERIEISSGIDFIAVESFFLSLTSMANLSLDLFFNFNTFGFPSDFYMLNQVWENGNWVNELRITTESNAQGLIASMLYQEWENDWTDVVEFEFTYDDKSRMEQALIRGDMEGTGNYGDALLITLVYNDDNTLQSINLALNQDGTFVDTYKGVYTYDDNGNQIEEITSLYLDFLGWSNIGRVLSEYNSVNLLIAKTTQSSILGTPWENASREEYDYNASDLLETHLLLIWDNDDWKNLERFKYEYNAENFVTKELFEMYSSGNWENVEQYLYSYNTTNNLEEELYQIWSGSDWQNSERSLLTYNDSDKPAEVINQEWIDEWIDVEKIIFTYATSTSVALADNAVPESYTLSNYPNPFNPTTNIVFNLPEQEILTVTIIDITGRTVRSITQGEQFSAGEHQVIWDGKNDLGKPVTTGTYVIKLSGKNFQQVRNITLLK